MIEKTDMIRLYKIGFVLWRCVSAVGVLAQTVTLKSPDGRITF